jgi:hypothetical protein
MKEEKENEQPKVFLGVEGYFLKTGDIVEGVNIELNGITYIEDSLVPVNKVNEPALVHCNIMFPLSVLSIEDAPVLYSAILRHIASRILWNVKNLEKYLRNFRRISFSSFKHLLMMELAYVLDSAYSSHISSCDKVYVCGQNNSVLLVDNSCSRLDTPCFRTKTEAEIAIRLLSILELYFVGDE